MTELCKKVSQAEDIPGGSDLGMWMLSHHDPFFFRISQLPPSSPTQFRDPVLTNLLQVPQVYNLLP